MGGKNVPKPKKIVSDEKTFNKRYYVVRINRNYSKNIFMNDNAP